MGPCGLYLLVFIFGYLTHKTFYFFRSMRLSLGLIRVSQLVSLAVLAKAMEHFYYSHTARLRQMREDDEGADALKECRRVFGKEIASYQDTAIREMLILYPQFYNSIIHFDDWKSGMRHLNENKEFVLKILAQDSHD